MSGIPSAYLKEVTPKRCGVRLWKYLPSRLGVSPSLLTKVVGFSGEPTTYHLPLFGLLCSFLLVGLRCWYDNGAFA